MIYIDLTTVFMVVLNDNFSEIFRSNKRRKKMGGGGKHN